MTLAKADQILGKRMILPLPRLWLIKITGPDKVKALSGICMKRFA